MIYNIIALFGAVFTTYSIVRYNYYKQDKIEKRSFISQMKRAQYHYKKLETIIKNESFENKKKLIEELDKAIECVVADEWPMKMETINKFIRLREKYNSHDEEILPRILIGSIKKPKEFNKKKIEEMEKEMKNVNSQLKKYSTLIIIGLLIHVSSLPIAIAQYVY